jgi:hypothetical protein
MLKEAFSPPTGMIVKFRLRNTSTSFSCKAVAYPVPAFM